METSTGMLDKCDGTKSCNNLNRSCFVSRAAVWKQNTTNKDHNKEHLFFILSSLD